MFVKILSCNLSSWIYCILYFLVYWNWYNFSGKFSLVYRLFYMDEMIVVLIFKRVFGVEYFNRVF